MPACQQLTKFPQTHIRQFAGVAYREMPLLVELHGKLYLKFVGGCPCGVQ